MDNGGKFAGCFTDLCTNMGLKKKPSNSWNPQTNAILEQIHQVLGDGLRAFDLDNMDINKDDDPFDKYITAVAYAICSVYHRTHRNPPEQLVYGLDMFLQVDQKIELGGINHKKATNDS